jgi:polyhydroxyalkanoate synthesis repressor PhaR
MNERAQATVLVKRYAGTRLYDTDAARYLSLEDIGEMLRSGRRLTVRDARSGEDVTQAVLAQIVAGSR